MTEPIGKIEKPEAEYFTGKRKLYLVPLYFLERTLHLNMWRSLTSTGSR